MNGANKPVLQYDNSPRVACVIGGSMEEAPLNVTFWKKFVLQKLSNLLELNFRQAYIDFMYRVNPYVPDCKNGSSITAR